MNLDWLLVIEVIYVILVILVCLRVIYDTRSTTKTAAYILLVIFVPIGGIFIYFSFGINYRKRKIYNKKIIKDSELDRRIKEEIVHYSLHNLERKNPAIAANKELARLLLNDGPSPLTSNNDVQVLVNGEQKFPAVLEALEKAQHHIHIEYYIYEDDEIGRAIEAVLCRKAQEGVTVRFIYDDFGSRTIRKKMVRRLRAAGVHAFAFHKIIFIALANRLNYRNHRKIIVIDGGVGFVGGINVSDRYINSPDRSQQQYWRDTHLRIEGPGVHYLQYLFLADWNFCAGEQVQPDYDLFPKENAFHPKGNKIVQMAASGPDSDRPTILFSLLQAIHLAQEEILITTPYFIPGESILEALIVSALGGLKVKLLVPGESDSVFVNTAARSYYGELLKAGVEIYLYRKGFVHAKTMVTDSKVAIVGSANMDYRSFDLNFEVNAIVYDQEVAGKLRTIFYEDIKDAEKIDPVAWDARPWYLEMKEKTARLVAPML
ncbi:cardiolipin synthase [Paraflavitalea sp. CAU 1676]|uniref:cardiolipin synthase n=1 Tax=Paraflavitalea sp. CAU 1676 TaxID=3032598 RepID=UPI0023DC7A9B|nr:cardiolipin synthase [Paraflavitalea sp. CAU 1676]MDF2188883.1 cardiolipin synthase [Paraflavitalea sp. CAU 1676]